MEPALDAGDDDGQIAMMAIEAEPDIEPFLLDVKRHLNCQEIKAEDPRGRRSVRRSAKSFLLWNGELFRRTQLGPKIILPKPMRKEAIVMFHDNIGHWDGETTRQFIVERYWWPNVVRDVFGHVKSCKGCQLASPVPKYRTTLRMPLTGLFDTFSIDFAGPLPVGPGGEKYALVAVEHLTSWPMVLATTTDTADTVLKFIAEQIVHPFGPPGTIISDNARCFTAAVVENLVSSYGTRWKTVAEYAPMSNGRVERMVGSIKRAIAKTIFNGHVNWVESIPDILFGYRRRRLAGHPSPFQLMYGVPPRMTPRDPTPLLQEPLDPRSRALETFAIKSERASRDLVHRPSSPDKKQYRVGDRVLVAKGRALGALKMPAFECKWAGPCTVISARHPLYRLELHHGKVSRKAIHARRLRPFYSRAEMDARNALAQEVAMALPHLPIFRQ